MTAKKKNILKCIDSIVAHVIWQEADEVSRTWQMLTMLTSSLPTLHLRPATNENLDINTKIAYDYYNGAWIAPRPVTPQLPPL